MIISLTGFMGSGKSTVARCLGSVLGCGCIDLDEVIESHACRHIHEIFELEGETVFRKMEAAALNDCLRKGEDRELTVIALGGGAIEAPASLERIKNCTCCVFLKASAQTLWQRLQQEGCDSDRPLLKGIDLKGFEVMLNSRSAHYDEASRLTVDTEGKGIEDICSEIIGKLGLFA